MTAALQMAATAEVTAFYEHAEWTGAHASKRDTWLKARREILSASDVAAILGEDPYRSALDVYVDKVTERIDEVLGLDDARFWGLVLEQPILRAVAMHNGWNYRQGGYLLRSRKHPLIGATLDAEVDRGAGWVPFEGKTTRIPRGWDEESGELPTRVLIQAQTQLLVTGADCNVVFALLQGSRPCQVDVHPSEEFHGVIIEEAERFMERVRELDPPPPVEGVSSKDALTRLYPEGDGRVVALPREAIEWTREYIELGRQIKAMETRREYLADTLRASIGSYTYGLLPFDVEGKRVWRCQTEERAGYTVAPAKFRKLLAMKGIK